MSSGANGVRSGEKDFAGKVREEVQRISASPEFLNSERMVRFLRFVVDKSLAGDPDAIKEYTLGIEVFDRGPDFDPRSDTIVRVEARRLRRKLKEYYEAGGTNDPVLITMPSPGYAPVFTPAPVSTELKKERTSRRWHFGWFTAAILVAVLLGVAAYIQHARIAGATPSSVAVLPFTNLSADASQGYFCDGFTEELIGTLAGIQNLRVVARTSVFEYKDKPKDVREVGRKLGVDALVEGSVRREGDTVRITAQLVKTSDGTHIWSRSWDRYITDSLALQSDIAQAVAETFRRSLKPAAAPQLNLEAYDLYLLGRQHWNLMTPGELQKSVGYFEQAIAKDPNFALAYSGLSEAYSYMIDMDFAPTRLLGAKARAAADRALSLDEGLAEAHTSRGLVALDCDWDTATADKEFRRAIELKPSFAYGIHWYAHFLDSRGRLAEAEREMKRALQLDPLSRMLIIDAATIAYKQRKYGEAMRLLDRVRALEPEYSLLEFAYGVTYMAQGKHSEAVAALRKARQQFGVPLVVSALGMAEASSGDRKAASADLDSLLRLAKTEYVPGYSIAFIYYALGDRVNGLMWLRRAYDDRSAMLLYMRNTPLVDTLRADPEAASLLDRMGS